MKRFSISTDRKPLSSVSTGVGVWFLNSPLAWFDDGSIVGRCPPFREIAELRVLNISTGGDKYADLKQKKKNHGPRQPFFHAAFAWLLTGELFL
jgi:hypothetical protein